MINILNKKVVTGILAAAVASGAGIFCSSQIILAQKPTKTIYADASWSYGYGNIDELIQQSDLVALVTIGEKTKEWSIGNIPKTDFEAVVKKPYINSIKGQKIYITQTAGITELNGEKVNFELGDDPVVQPGEEYVIFARENDKGTYTILGGSQGKLKNINGKLHAMKYVSKRVEAGNININGVAIDELEKTFKHKDNK
ncbi:hypothetical protein DFP93_103213 [Aneurinibacillus soli]|uniref:Uncharacterized protein n=1 Tax=Aneurinibacillus soli TaxID=1500254 RepID=A0A0U5BD93_9BACL|nr:hypothetical protein [Aneurinibacillus soli]PYE63001.1 hypothetical protein DFP93_103213 [Aneurinibacillus soli]BAU28940.1 hypothetical protein CB4_03117 [Aneurinibacillus soli]